MALLEVNYRSAVLGRTVPLMVVLPTDRDPKHAEPYPTLYLLHGLHENYGTWCANTRIQRWAEARNLAVVMPSGENSFYVDQSATGGNYGEYVGRELVEITRRMFPLSHRREDTFIGGLSMGGFGALRNGLKYHETFGAIISLSGAVDILHSKLFEDNRLFAEAIFGPLEEAKRSDKDPRFLVKQLPAEAAPRLYFACGTEDFLLPQNRCFRQILEEAGYDLTYVEGPGTHNWDFWDPYIEKALDWLK